MIATICYSIQNRLAFDSCWLESVKETILLKVGRVSKISCLICRPFEEISNYFSLQVAETAKFQLKKNQAGMALSAKIWELKDAGRSYEVKNKIVRRVHPHKTGDSVCDLCLTEKTCIVLIVLGHKAPPEFFVLPPGCGLLNVRD